MEQSTKVRGFKELAESLRAIAPELYAKHALKAVTKATRVIRLRAVANASKVRDLGALSRSIIDVSKKSRNKKPICIGLVGPDSKYFEVDAPHRRTKSGKVIPVKYAALVEYGVETRETGSMPATPWLRPALHSAEADARGILANEMRAGLEQAVKNKSKSVK